jgi:hypothetical protein
MPRSQNPSRRLLSEFVGRTLVVLLIAAMLPAACTRDRELRDFSGRWVMSARKPDGTIWRSLMEITEGGEFLTGSESPRKMALLGDTLIVQNVGGQPLQFLASGDSLIVIGFETQVVAKRSR